jgi:hypothetical protein
MTLPSDDATVLVAARYFPDIPCSAPDTSKKIAVPIRREFYYKALNLLSKHDRESEQLAEI